MDQNDFFSSWFDLMQLNWWRNVGGIMIMTDWKSRH